MFCSGKLGFIRDFSRIIFSYLHTFNWSPSEVYGNDETELKESERANEIHAVPQTKSHRKESLIWRKVIQSSRYNSLFFFKVLFLQ